MEEVSKAAKKKTTKQIIDLVAKMPDTFDSNKKKLIEMERKLGFFSTHLRKRS